jgi:hypothetical protein
MVVTHLSHSYTHVNIVTQARHLPGPLLVPSLSPQLCVHSQPGKQLHHQAQSLVAELEGAREELRWRGGAQAPPIRTVVSPFPTSQNKHCNHRCPMLFVMGERDKFMSVNQLEQMAMIMRGEGVNGGGIVDIKITPGFGHYEQEKPGYYKLVMWMVLDWLDKILA